RQGLGRRGPGTGGGRAVDRRADQGQLPQGGGGDQRERPRGPRADADAGEAVPAPAAGSGAPDRLRTRRPHVHRRPGSLAASVMRRAYFEFSGPPEATLPWSLLRIV